MQYLLTEEEYVRCMHGHTIAARNCSALLRVCVQAAEGIPVGPSNTPQGCVLTAGAYCDDCVVLDDCPSEDKVRARGKSPGVNGGDK